MEESERNMNNENSLITLRELVEVPIVNILKLYIQYIEEGLISKNNAKCGIEEYGFVTCVFEVNLPQETSHLIDEYRRRIVDWAKSVIDDLLVKGE